MNTYESMKLCGSAAMAAEKEKAPSYRSYQRHRAGFMLASGSQNLLSRYALHHHLLKIEAALRTSSNEECEQAVDAYLQALRVHLDSLRASSKEGGIPVLGGGVPGTPAFTYRTAIFADTNLRAADYLETIAHNASNDHHEDAEWLHGEAERLRAHILHQQEAVAQRRGNA